MAVTIPATHAQQSPNDGDYAVMATEGSPLVERVIAQSGRLKAARTAEEAADILPDYQAALDSFMNLMGRYSHSKAAPEFLIHRLTGFPSHEISRIWQCISEDVRAEDTEANRSLRSIVAEYSRLDKGQPAPLFTTVDNHGDTVCLADYKGKTVLLDFWASWCGPCRANMPHVMELYRKYHDVGFEVICIAADDNKKEAWHEAIEKDGTGELCHVLRGMQPRKPVMPGSGAAAARPSGQPKPASMGIGFIPGLTRVGNTEDLEQTSDIGAKYAVHAMPMHYLIAADGTLIGEMSGGLLEYHLRQIYGF